MSPHRNPLPVASYRCSGYGHEWECRWDSEATGWPTAAGRPE